MTLRFAHAALLSALLLGSGGCATQQEGPKVVATNMDRARLQIDRGLSFMRKAYAAEKRRESYTQFNLAIDSLQRANQIFLDELLKVSEAQRGAIEGQIERVDEILEKCYRDRPALED